MNEDSRKTNKVKTDYTVKYLILGNKSVGKTTLQMRYFDPDFEMDDMKSTIGVIQKIKKFDVLGKYTKL